MLPPIGQETYVRNQAYYDTLAKKLDNGMLYYNDRTGKTIFANRYCTAVINGDVPHGTRIINGKLDLSLFDSINNTPTLKKLTKRLTMLFNNPSIRSKAQASFMKKVLKFVLA